MLVPENKTTVIYSCLAAVLLCISPLLGVHYLGLPMSRYLEFPPRTKYVEHASFSWVVFLVLAILIISFCLPFFYRFFTWKREKEDKTGSYYDFPPWGWSGIAITSIFWVLAWNRFPFFEFMQRYTFFPLWLGYILFVNGWTCSKKGTCLLRTYPRFFLILFPASAFFWWYFEYLNRFVQNWYYSGGGNITSAEYIIHASVCFSTVLPAALSTCELLGTFPRLATPFKQWYPITFVQKKVYGWLLIGFVSLSLALLAVFPDYLFPLVWISPLLIITGVQFVTGRTTVFSALEKGDWRGIVLPALAALICGFFWEMWNWKSLAHWEYSVPFVPRFQIFAMPILGYAGYLPFGLECLVAASLINKKPFSYD